MGLLNKIFGSNQSLKKEEKIIPWNNLSTLEQLDSIVEESQNKPIAIFKYSSRCGTSRMALRQFENNYYIEDNLIKLYFWILLLLEKSQMKYQYDFKYCIKVHSLSL